VSVAAPTLRRDLVALSQVLSEEFGRLESKFENLNKIIDRMRPYESHATTVVSHLSFETGSPGLSAQPRLVDVLDAAALVDEQCDHLIRLIEMRRAQLHSKISRTVNNTSGALADLRQGITGALSQRDRLQIVIDAARAMPDLELCESYRSIITDIGNMIHNSSLEGMLRASIEPKVLMQFNSTDIQGIVTSFGHIANRPMTPLLLSVSNVVLGKVLLQWGAAGSVPSSSETRSLHLGAVVSPRAGGVESGRALDYDVEIVVSNDDVLMRSGTSKTTTAALHKFKAGEVIRIGTFGSDTTSKCFDLLPYGGHHLFFRVCSVEVNSGTRSPWCESEMIHVPRSFSKEFKYLHNKDTNGILYWLATNGHVEDWRNPHSMGYVTVSKYIPEGSSGNVHGNSPVRALVRSKPQVSVGYRAHRDLQMPAVSAPSNDEHYFVERPDYGLDANGFPKRMRCCVTSGSDGAWICVDFGPHKKVQARRYCLGFDSHVNHLAVRWVLEGSNDCQGPWTLLHDHVAKDLSSVFDTHESHGSWEVPISSGQDEAFRYFRVHQPSSHTSASAGFRGRPALACTGFELYGNMLVGSM
jgi:hypothetical protein